MNHLNRLAKATGAATALAVLALAVPAAAHQATIGVDCQTGINVTLTHYSGTDHVSVWEDGKALVDNAAFHGLYTFHADLDQSVAHSWRVKVDALPENSPDQSGQIGPCIVIPTTTSTTEPATTTTTMLAATTTTAAATSTTAAATTTVTPTTQAAATTTIVQEPEARALPRTGGNVTGMAIALALIAAGTALAYATRRPT